MTKVTGKPQGSWEVGEQQTLDTQEEKMKSSCQQMSKEVSRWAEPMQGPLAHWYRPIRHLPLSLPGPYPFSAHTPSPEAILPIHLHPFPQTNRHSVLPFFCFLQVARVTMRLNKPSGPELIFSCGWKLFDYSFAFHVRGRSVEIIYFFLVQFWKVILFWVFVHFFQVVHFTVI